MNPPHGVTAVCVCERKCVSVCGYGCVCVCVCVWGGGMDVCVCSAFPVTDAQVL